MSLKQLDDINRWPGQSATAFGVAYSKTPADDLVAAVAALNRAVEAARNAGWSVSVTANGPGSSKAISASISRET